MTRKNAMHRKGEEIKTETLKWKQGGKIESKKLSTRGKQKKKKTSKLPAFA